MKTSSLRHRSMVQPPTSKMLHSPELWCGHLLECVHICVHACLWGLEKCTHVWRPKVNPGCHSSGAVHHVFGNRVPHWPRTCLISWSATETQGSTYSASLVLFILSLWSNTLKRRRKAFGYLAFLGHNPARREAKAGSQTWALSGSHRGMLSASWLAWRLMFS